MRWASVASAKVVMDTNVTAEEIDKKEIKVDSEICVFKNDKVTIEKI